MTAAGVFAAQAEVCPGWTVERLRPGNGLRGVSVTRPGESFDFTWQLKPHTGNYVFKQGWHTVWEGERRWREPWENLKAALRVLKDPGTVRLTDTGYYRLPFDPEADAADIYPRLRGRELTWENSITGIEEKAIVPYDGKLTKLDAAPDPAKRVLTFASYEAGQTPVAGYPHGKDTRCGIRSVKLSAIRGVGSKCYKPRGVV
ncbi:MAG TPA: hypothetical protein VGP33_06625 [Chloroflexota bacterium]|jgi:hypothetical protein|nr:hypothetical protein [Chloroflexota bacterium]